MHILNVCNRMVYYTIMIFKNNFNVLLNVRLVYKTLL